MSEIAKEMKRVTFSPDTIEQSSETVIFSDITKKAKISGTKILSMLKRSQLEDLKTYLKNTDPNVVNKFFCSEDGQKVMSYLCSIPKNDRFHFISKNVPAGCLKSAIRQNSYALLVEFLTKQQIVEEYNADSVKDRAIRIDKFKFLLEIDEDVEIFMNISKKNKESFITQKIMDDFSEASSYNTKLKLKI